MLCLCVSDLILQAGAEDQIVIVHFTIRHQLHVLVLAVDGLHLTRHHTDPGAKRQLGLILIAVAVTVEEQKLYLSCTAMKRAVFKCGHKDIRQSFSVTFLDSQCSRLTDSFTVLRYN